MASPAEFPPEKTRLKDHEPAVHELIDQGSS